MNRGVPAMHLSDVLIRTALESGFDFAAITPCAPPPQADMLDEWLRLGYAAEMKWMTRNPRLRKNPALFRPECRSVLIVGVNYLQNRQALSPNEPHRGRIARYAWGRDYHKTMSRRLKQLARSLRERFGENLRSWAFTDTAPLLEKPLAVTAGLGFTGKNSLLIHPDFGSWVFLGELLLDREFEPRSTVTPGEGCGTCNLCRERCPTGALDTPYLLDSRRCISYLTIENRGPIPREFRPLIGNRIFGCDICQECCPFNAGNKPVTAVADFISTDSERQEPALFKLAGMNETQFAQQFHGSPIRRARRRGLMRNVAVALGNTADPDGVPALVNLIGDPEPLVRAHAAWALGRIGNKKARETLARAAKKERDQAVLEEITAA